MRKILCIAALSVAASSSGFAQQKEFSKNFIDVKTGTWTGVVLERSCFQKLGPAKAAAIENRSCIDQALAKGLPLGVLTDDDGFMNIVGEVAKDGFAAATQYIGKRVVVSGTSALPTGNYIPRQIDITKIELEKN
jgi:hypothetical protein